MCNNLPDPHFSCPVRTGHEKNPSVAFADPELSGRAVLEGSLVPEQDRDKGFQYRKFNFTLLKQLASSGDLGKQKMVPSGS